MVREKFDDPYDRGWRDGYEACKVENNLPSHKTVLDNKDLREVIDKSYNAGYEEAKKLLENSIFGKIDQFWTPTGDKDDNGEPVYQKVVSMIYDRKDFEDLVFKKMGLCPGDKVIIAINKQQ